VFLVPSTNELVLWAVQFILGYVPPGQVVSDTVSRKIVE
jgi:hypothetical protein